MINLTQILKQYYEEDRLKRRGEENEHQTSDNLISSAQSSNEVHNVYDPEIGIVQPNQQNLPNPRIVPLGDAARSNESGNTVPDTLLPNIGDKINITAALLTLFLYVCAISLIVYGSIHLNDCPAQKMITISFIAMGCLMFVSRALSIPEEYKNICKKESNPHFTPQTVCRACLNLILQVATMCFFIALCYWIFHINPDFTEGSPNYCQKELYKNTYYGCIISLSLVGIIFLLTCCGICVACWCSKK